MHACAGDFRASLSTSIGARSFAALRTILLERIAETLQYFFFLLQVTTGCFYRNTCYLVRQCLSRMGRFPSVQPDNPCQVHLRPCCDTGNFPLIGAHMF